MYKSVGAEYMDRGERPKQPLSSGELGQQEVDSGRIWA